jgi:hypothetical protein
LYIVKVIGTVLIAKLTPLNFTIMKTVYFTTQSEGQLVQTELFDVLDKAQSVVITDIVELISYMSDTIVYMEDDSSQGTLELLVTVGKLWKQYPAGTVIVK